MPGDDNTMQVTAIEAEVWNPELHQLAFGTPEAQDEPTPADPQDGVPADAQGVTPTAGTGVGAWPTPRYFLEDQEPMNDGTYRDVGGAAFYRPDLDVAPRRPGLAAGPDVWFQRDASGGLRLEWTLADVPPPDAGPDAVPFPGLFTARLGWDTPDGNATRAFDPPTLLPLPDPGDGPRFLLRGGTSLSAEEAEDIEKLMRDKESGCRLEIDFDFTYEVAYAGNGQYEHCLDQMGLAADQLGLGGQPTPDAVLGVLDGLGWNADQRKAYGIDEDEFLASLWRYERRQPQLNQWVPFVFDLNDDANRLVYVALHGTADLPLDWRKSAAGWVRDSGFPNTVYRLPDELRLAFDPALGTPHVLTTLHTTGDGNDGGAAGVRVLLRVAPWQDPRKVVQVRELVGRAPRR